jgi:uncharacterized Fe-S cluster-containing protein
MASAALPGLNCGLCGFKKCEQLAEKLLMQPELIKRCIPLSKDQMGAQKTAPEAGAMASGEECGMCAAANVAPMEAMSASPEATWRDSLGREFDFLLEHFPEDPGPREIILPHNPLITREAEVQPGDTLIGRPLGMSCGCPITHCGIAMEVDRRTGVIVWCVTGPLQARKTGYKDLGYYVAEAYEGLIRKTRCEIRIGCRYYFQPRMCMLQWRHSGLVNYMNRAPEGLQVRLEGLWIG